MYANPLSRNMPPPAPKRAAAALTLLFAIAATPASGQFMTANPDLGFIFGAGRIALTAPSALSEKPASTEAVDGDAVGSIRPAPPWGPAAAVAPNLPPSDLAGTARGVLNAAAPPALSPSPAAAPAPLAATDADAGFVLRHLPNNIQGFRLNGETGASEWPIYLSAAQARSRLRFRLGYISAVSVMPEASKITMSINDVEIGATRVAAFDKVESVDFDIPAGVLEPGFNALRIAVDERHRVDCSLEATYELWTQIDPSQTGFLMPIRDSRALDLADLAALPPDAQGVLPVRAVLPGRTSPGNIERVIRAVQIIASGGHFEQPMVDVGPMAGGEYGVNLVIGVAADVAATPDLAEFANVDGPRLSVLPATPMRRATIVITGRTQDDVNRALVAFGKAAQPHGSLAGLRASQAFPGYRVSGGQTVRLSDLGLHSVEFSGRYFRAGFNVVMPADFFSADYAKVLLDLAGGYAPGLSSSAKIIVAINGRNAVSVPLSNSHGEVFTDKTLPLPLGFFRSGLNRIEIQAQLSNAADAACDPLSAIAGNKRFLFLDSTTLRIPRLARISRVPDLAVTASGGFPFIGGTKQPKLYAPSADTSSIAAAATFAARIAASAGRPIDFRFTVTPPPVGSGATLIVAAAGQLDPATARAVGLDPDRMRVAWGDRLVASNEPRDQLSPVDIRARNRLVLQKNLPAACHLRHAPAAVAAAPIDLAALLASPPDARKADDRELFEQWSESLAGQERWRKWIGEAGARLGALAHDLWRGTIDEAQTLVADGDEQAAKIIYQRDNSLLIAQSARGATADDVWTLVTAPNSSVLAESVECVSDPRVWRLVDGRISILNDSDGAVSSLPPKTVRFVVTQPLSLSNVRLIAAGWFSLNAGAYVSLVLVVAFLLAIATHGFVRNVGRRVE